MMARGAARSSSSGARLLLGLAAVAEAAALRLKSRRILFAAAGVGALPFLAAVLLALLGEKASWGLWRNTFEMWLDAALPLAGLLLGVQAVGTEVDEGTCLVIWGSGLPRWALPVGQLLALVPVAALLALVFLSLALILAPGQASWLRILASGVSVIVAATALGTLAGALFPRHGVAASLAFAGLSYVFTKLPGKARLLSPLYHAHRIAGFPTDTPWDKFWPPPRLSPWGSLLVIGFMIALFVVASALWVEYHEYRGRAGM